MEGFSVTGTAHPCPASYGLVSEGGMMIEEVMPPDRDRMRVVWSDLPDRFQDGPSVGCFIDAWRSV